MKTNECLYKSNPKGFTLLEVVVSSAIFLMVILAAANLLHFASRFLSRIAVRQELQENSRVAMDFIVTHIRRANKITLITDEESTLKALTTTEIPRNDAQHSYTFNYNKGLTQENAKYHRLELGGNELASYIRDVKMEFDQETQLLKIRIVTDDGTGDGTIVEPVVLSCQEDLRYKHVRRP